MQLQALNKNSFSYKLISFVFLVMILVYLVINLVIYRVVSELMIRNTRDYLGTLVDERVSHFDGRLKNIATQGRILNSVLEDNLLSEEKLNSYLVTVMKDNSDLTSICVAPDPQGGTNIKAGIYQIDSAGKLIFTPIEPAMYQYRDWYQMAILKEATYWGEPWYDEIGAKLLICSYSLPLVRDDKIVGVLRLDTAVRNMQNLHLPGKLFDEAYAFILSNTGTIITHPADSLVMNYTIFNLADEYDDQDLVNIGRNMIKGGSELVKVSGVSYFQDQWIYYADLPSNHWTIAIVVNNSYIFADMKQLLGINFAVSILGFLVISIVIYLRTLKLHKPLKQISEAAARIGSGDFDTPLTDPSGILEIEQLTDALHKMKESLKTYIASLSDLRLEQEKIQSEMMFASEVQRSLVPVNLPLENSTRGINCYGILQPAGMIGGDLYDYFMIDDHHFCFTIADVVGKGIVASMTMTMVTTLLRAISRFKNTPAEMLYALNTFLSSNKLESNLITIMLGIIDTRDGKLWFSNCGHVPWYQRKAERRIIRHDRTHSTALGIFPEITIDDQIIRLELGDQLVLMTDGVTEAMNEAGDYFGVQGIEAALGGLQNPGPDVTANTLCAAVESFASSTSIRDDLTILVIEFTHPQQFKQ